MIIQANNLYGAIGGPDTAGLDPVIEAVLRQGGDVGGGHHTVPCQVTLRRRRGRSRGEEQEEEEEQEEQKEKGEEEGKELYNFAG